MARQPNYGLDRMERQRKKDARREERLAARAERREKNRKPDPNPADSTPQTVEESPKGPLWDGTAATRLARALAFVCGADHPATLAVRRAGETGKADDTQRARDMFLQLRDQDQRAALTIAAER